MSNLKHWRKSFRVIRIFIYYETHIILGFSLHTRHYHGVFSLHVRLILLWDFTSHKTYLVVYFHFAWDPSYCGILCRMRHISYFTSYETHLVRFYVTLDTFRCGISLHARDMFVGQHVGIVDRNISHLGTFIYYVSTEVRVDVHQHVNVASLSLSYRY